MGGMSFGIQNTLTRVATGLIGIRATESRLVRRLTMTRDELPSSETYVGARETRNRRLAFS